MGKTGKRKRIATPTKGGGRSSRHVLSCRENKSNVPPVPPATVHEALVAALQEIHKTSPPYWYQIVYRNQEDEFYSSIGKFHELLGIELNQSLEVLSTGGLVVENKQLQAKKKVFEALRDSIDGSDFAINHQRGGKRYTFILLGIVGQKTTLKDQLGENIKPPLISSLSDTINRFKQAPSVAEILASLTSTLELSGGTDTLQSMSAGTTLDIDPDVLIDDPPTKYNRLSRWTMLHGVPTQCPNGHKLISKARLRSSDEKVAIVDSIAVASKKKKACSMDEQMKIVIGTMAAHYVQLPDTPMEQVLVFGSLIACNAFKLSRLQTDNCQVTFDQLSNIMPSRSTVSTYVRETAAHRIVVIGERLVNAAAVFLGADKGADVLVKKAYFFDKETKQITKMNLDFNKAADDAKGAGEAIKLSLEKYLFNENKGEVMKGMLKGGGSDSGGGFTGVAMKNALVQVGLANEETWIHCPCTSHNDQTNLRVAVETVYGQGGLDQRNVLQLVHAFADLQKACGETDDVSPYLIAVWEVLHGDNSQVPKDLLYLMQEPILTRWKTVGEGCQYVYKYIDALIAFAGSVCATENTHSQKNKCASNFKSLAEEPAIASDLAFFTDFDIRFFNDHMEFNHSVDGNIGVSGFLAPHHLVRYFLKMKDLEMIKKELEHGSVDAAPHGCNFERFWKKLKEVEDIEDRQKSLDRARKCIEVYMMSLDKHNEHFCRENMFLACFGEQETATIVSRYLTLAENKENEFGAEEILQGGRSTSIHSEIHDREIKFEDFASFIHDRCCAGAQECIKTRNYDRLKEVIENIAEGKSFWGTSGEQAEADRMFYLENFGALPSTMEDVERSVKRARLCQETGRGERNVTAYGIAGDNVSSKCKDDLVSSNYADKMKQRRKQQQDAAAVRGEEPRSKGEYEEDIERGPSCTANIVNHALSLCDQVKKLRQDIGPEEYKRRYQEAFKSLTDLAQQGTTIRHNAKVTMFKATVRKSYRPSAREKESGVLITPTMAGEIEINKCRKGDGDNFMSILEEALARGLLREHDRRKYIEGKTQYLNYSTVRKMISEDVKRKWEIKNIGKSAPSSIGKTFKPMSKAAFEVKK
jgi:hypothetical protein